MKTKTTTTLRVFLLVLLGCMLGTMKMMAQYAAISSDGTQMYFCNSLTEAQSLGAKTFQIATASANVSPAWYNNSAVDLTKITTVEFKPSFAEVRNIRSTKDWFHGMTRLKSVKGMQNINSSGIWQFDSMFEGCSALEFLYMNGVTGQTLESVYLSLNYMFKGCSKLKFVDLTNFSNVGETREMFSGCSSLKVLDLSSFKKDIQFTMREMFSGCSSLKTIHVGSGWNTTSISDAYSQNMFYGCTSLVGGNGTEYNASYTGKTYARIDASGTPGYFTKHPHYAVYNEGKLSFYNDDEINSREGTKYTIYENPVVNNDHIYTGVYADGNYLNVNTVAFYDPLDPAPYCKNDGDIAMPFYWFYKMENLTTIGLMPYFYTSSLESMAHMFDGCKSLTSLNLTYFSTNKVTEMDYMFYGCTSLTSLELGTFNTKNVASCEAMFSGCSNLKSIFVGEDWDVQHLYFSKSSNMFFDCEKLVGSAGTTWKGNNYEDRQYAIVDGGTDKPGYLSNSPYAVLSTDKTTFTFYADGKKSKKEGIKYNLRRWGTSALADVTKVVFDASFTTARPTSTASWFEGASKLTTITSIERLNTSEVTSMEKMFNGCESLTSVDVSKFNTEKVTNMSLMFYDCKSLTSVDVSKFDTRQVTDMNAMFKNCTALTLLNLTSFNTMNVTNMMGMFRGDEQLTTIFISPTFTTGKVSPYYSNNMFEGCVNLKGGAGTAYDESKVDKTYARADNALGNPGYLSYRPYVVQSTDNTTIVFYADGAPGTKQGKVYNVPFNGDYPYWVGSGYPGSVTTAVFDMSFLNARPTSTYGWFNAMSKLTTIENLIYLNTTEVKDMQFMFNKCSKLKTLDLSNFNTEKVTNMKGMFSGCSALTTIYASNWNTDAVTESSNMFSGCSKLTGGAGTTCDGVNNIDKTYAHIDGGSSNPGYFSESQPYAVLNGNTLTFYADGLQSEKTGSKFSIPAGAEDPDWYREEVITKVVFAPSFAAARPTSTYGWFLDLTNLTTIEGIEYLNTSEVTIMQNMFRNTKLTTIDLRYFNTANVTDMLAMFAENSQLTTILAGANWSVEKLRTGSYMFSDCPNLVGGAGTRYDSDHTDVSYAHIDGGASNPGYFTSPPPYAVLSEDETTLSFYYDGLDGLKSGTVYSLNQGTDTPAWYTNHKSGLITTVVFDPSFANALPTTTKDWFVAMSNLTSIDGIGYLNTSEVTNMESMFSLCRKLDNVDVSGFDTRKVTTMNSMFNECNALETLDLTNFDVSQVTNMGNMFSNCTSLTTIYAGSNWNEGFSGSDGYMFANCPNLVGGAGSEWEEGHYGIYYAHIDDGEMDPGYFTAKPYAIYDVNTNLLTLYNDGKLLEKTGKKYYLNASDENSPGWLEVAHEVKKFVFDESFASARPTSTKDWFYQMSNLQEIEGLELLNTSKVTNMQSMFSRVPFTELDLSHFDTRNVTDMRYMFWECQNLQTIYVGDDWNTDNVTNENGWGIFYECRNLVGSMDTEWIDGGWPNWGVQYAHIDGGPSNPGYLSQVPTEPYVVLFNKTLTFYSDGKSGEKEGKVYSLPEPDEVPEYSYQTITKAVFDPSFATARPTSTNSWFYACNNMVEIEGLEYLNTSRVTDMKGMFAGCKSLTMLDLTHFNTQKVTDMSIMFNICNKLKTIYVGDGWSTSSLANNNSLFSGCTALVGGAGTVYASNHIGPDYAHIDGGSSNPGYFTQGPAPMGDVNRDGKVDVADVTALVNMLKSGNAEYRKVADVDYDGSITDYDVKALVNNVLGSYPLMYVEDVFSLSTSKRTVATGQILKGLFHTGQPVVLSSISDDILDVEFEVNGIEVFREIVDVAAAGDGVGITVPVESTQVQRGDVLTIKNNPELLHSKTVKGTLYVLTKDEGGRHTPFFVNYSPQMYVAGGIFTVKCTNLGSVGGQAVDMVMPGSTSENIVFEVVEDGKTPYVYPGQVVLLREGGRTIGRLTITE